ncbi:AsnC family protein [Haloechinothrix sp. YIM 98757]|uniref:AsnC family protein n=1 Tax=Haloechinothrix aidingensis TaxID=2752311 RepID=A0A838A8V1_9PSEU|nr:AsnC family protein [Haloechinothrix aidingensis]
MAVTDPADARLLAALAEHGKAPVHDVAARAGMDPREAAYRLVGLSGSGLPLLVGVECDPQGVRAALPPQGHGYTQQAPQQTPQQGAPPGAYPGPQQAQPPSSPAAPPATPSGPYPVHGAPSGPHPAPPPPSGPHAAPGQPQASGAGAPAAPEAQAPAPDAAMSVWGPPQSAGWARGDQQAPGRSGPVAGTAARHGTVGDTLHTEGLESEQLSIQLLEVQDPADFLFGAGGYQLAPGERAVVVHTEVTNTGTTAFGYLPDNFLELVTADGTAIAKAPVSLTSRPPHRIGVGPGQTAGGHTVYILPESTRLASVRWSPRPEPDERTVTWTVDE